MNKLDKPILDKMFEENSQSIEEKIYEKNKKLSKLSEKSLSSLCDIYSLLKKYHTSKEFNEEFESRIKKLINDYTAEQNYVCFLFYKQGIIHGFENREKLEQEL